MSPEEILNELKDKRLPTYGTAVERKDRLKKQYGIVVKSKSAIGVLPGQAIQESIQSQAIRDQRRVTTTDKINQININR